MPVGVHESVYAGMTGRHNSALRVSPLFTERHFLACELAAETLHSEGKLRLQVIGSSMLPAVLPGDVLILERAAAGVIREGDIVLFSRDRRLFAHRVIATSIGVDQIQTRGDAMTQVDAPLSHDQLLGRVSKIVRSGNSIDPSRRLRFPQTWIAACAKHSVFARRIVLGMHGMRQRIHQKERV